MVLNGCKMHLIVKCKLLKNSIYQKYINSDLLSKHKNLSIVSCNSTIPDRLKDAAKSILSFKDLSASTTNEESPELASCVRISDFISDELCPSSLLFIELRVKGTVPEKRRALFIVILYSS